MANIPLLTNLAKTSSVGLQYFSPSSQLRVTGVQLFTLYAFLSKVDPWPDDANPPAPTQDQKSLKQIMSNMFVSKEITTNDMSPVVERIDWNLGQIYDYYRDDVNMVELDDNGKLVRKFYVINRYYQVFKCLWNNSYSPSTIEPYFEPGTYGTNNIFNGTDGYKWKYLFTVDSGLRNKFLDNTWIPISTNNLSPSSFDINPLSETNLGAGNIDVINVLSGGSGYDPTNTIVSVVITGDGTASNGTPYTTATASPVVTNGVITDITIIDSGKNYTYANATIVSTSGSGCVLGANTVSPIGGHGNDNISELGCSHVMITATFNGSENGFVPTDIDYHQIGLIVNPFSSATWPNPANSEIYRTSTTFIVSPGSGIYSPDELVYQSSGTIDTATFIGKVVSFDQTYNKLYVVSTIGTPTINQSLYSQSSTTRTLLSYSTPTFINYSGYIIYIENRSAIQRSSDGVEQFKIVIGY